MNPFLRRTFLLAVQIAAIGSSLSQAAMADTKDYTASELVMKFNDQFTGRVTFEVDWDHWNKDAKSFRVKAKVGNSKNAFPVFEEIDRSQDSEDPIAPLRTLKDKIVTLNEAYAERLAQAAQDFEADSKRLEANFQVKPSRMADGKINLNIQGCKDKDDALFTTLPKMEIGFHSEFRAGSIHYKQGTLDTSIKNAGSKALWKALTEAIGKCADSDPQKAKLEAARETLARASAESKDAIWTVNCHKDVTRSKGLPHNARNCEVALGRLFEKFNCPLVPSNGVQCDPKDDLILCQIRPLDRCHPAVDEPPLGQLTCEKDFKQRTITFYGAPETEIRFCQLDDEGSKKNSALLKRAKPSSKSGNTGEAEAAASGDAN